MNYWIAMTYKGWSGAFRGKSGIQGPFNHWQPTPWDESDSEKLLGKLFAFRSWYKAEKREIVYPGKIVGFGTCVKYAVMTIEEAAQEFGERNGAKGESGLIDSIKKSVGWKREHEIHPGKEIGCVILENLQFLASDEELATPSDWLDTGDRIEPEDKTPHRNYDSTDGAEGERIVNGLRAAARITLPPGY